MAKDTDTPRPTEDNLPLLVFGFRLIFFGWFVYLVFSLPFRANPF